MIQSIPDLLLAAIYYDVEINIRRLQDQNIVMVEARREHKGRTWSVGKAYLALDLERMRSPNVVIGDDIQALINGIKKAASQ